MTQNNTESLINLALKFAEYVYLHEGHSAVYEMIHDEIKKARESAANAHDELVEAVRELTEACINGTDNYGYASLSSAIKRGLDALAKAQEK